MSRWGGEDGFCAAPEASAQALLCVLPARRGEKAPGSAFFCETVPVPSTRSLTSDSCSLGLLQPKSPGAMLSQGTRLSQVPGAGLPGESRASWGLARIVIAWGYISRCVKDPQTRESLRTNTHKGSVHTLVSILSYYGM